jgi:hypothetical protein
MNRHARDAVVLVALIAGFVALIAAGKPNSAGILMMLGVFYAYLVH